MTEQPVKNGNGKAYLGVALAVASWIGGSLVQYGIMKTSQADLERRVATLEQDLRDNTVPRKEFELWQKDIRDRLDGIEKTLRPDEPVRRKE